MITISLDEKNAGLIVNLLKSHIDTINGQIKQLENDKKELEGLMDNFNHMVSPQVVNSPTADNITAQPIEESIQKEPVFVLKEIEFDQKSLPEITFGKNILRRSEDGQNIYLMRTGYRANIKARLKDLIYLQEHPFEVESALTNLSRNKISSLTRILKEIDFNKLDLIFQSCTPNNKQDQEEIKTEKTEKENQTENLNKTDNQTVQEKDDIKQNSDEPEK